MQAVRVVMWQGRAGGTCAKRGAAERGSAWPRVARVLDRLEMSSSYLASCASSSLGSAGYIPGFRCSWYGTVLPGC